MKEQPIPFPSFIKYIEPGPSSRMSRLSSSGPGSKSYEISHDYGNYFLWELPSWPSYGHIQGKFRPSWATNVTIYTLSGKFIMGFNELVISEINSFTTLSWHSRLIAAATARSRYTK